MGFGEEIDDRLGDDRADALDPLELGEGRFVLRGSGGGVAKRLHRPEAFRQVACRHLADVADAEREQEPVERRPAPGVDRGDEVPR